MNIRAKLNGKQLTTHIEENRENFLIFKDWYLVWLDKNLKPKKITTNLGLDLNEWFYKNFKIEILEE